MFQSSRVPLKMVKLRKKVQIQMNTGVNCAKKNGPVHQKLNVMIVWKNKCTKVDAHNVNRFVREISLFAEPANIKTANHSCVENAICLM